MWHGHNGLRARTSARDGQKQEPHVSHRPSYRCRACHLGGRPCRKAGPLLFGRGGRGTRSITAATDSAARPERCDTRGEISMHTSQLHYWPLAPTFLAVLVGALLALLVLIQLGILRYAYMRIGVSSRVASLLLIGSLVGSYINIPVAQIPEQEVVSGREIIYFGMHYMVPVVVDWPGTVIAVNVGGALIPGLMSLYLLARYRLWLLGLASTACVGAVCYSLADPVPGVGIALPVFVPALTTALVALLLSYRQAAPLAFISGSLGTLIGADLLNLDKVQGLGAPI